MYAGGKSGTSNLANVVLARATCTTQLVVSYEAVGASYHHFHISCIWSIDRGRFGRSEAL